MWEISDIATEIDKGDKDEEMNDNKEDITAKILPFHTAALEALEVLHNFF